MEKLGLKDDVGPTEAERKKEKEERAKAYEKCMLDVWDDKKLRDKITGDPTSKFYVNPEVRRNHY